MPLTFLFLFFRVRFIFLTTGPPRTANWSQTWNTPQFCPRLTSGLVGIRLGEWTTWTGNLKRWLWKIWETYALDYTDHRVFNSILARPRKMIKLTERTFMTGRRGKALERRWVRLRWPLRFFRVFFTISSPIVTACTNSFIVRSYVAESVVQKQSDICVFHCEFTNGMNSTLPSVETSLHNLLFVFTSLNEWLFEFSTVGSFLKSHRVLEPVLINTLIVMKVAQDYFSPHKMRSSWSNREEFPFRLYGSNMTRNGTGLSRI